MESLAPFEHYLPFVEFFKTKNLIEVLCLGPRILPSTPPNLSSPEWAPDCMVIKLGRQVVCTTPIISRIRFPYVNRYTVQKVSDMNNPFSSSPEARVDLNISWDKLFQVQKMHVSLLGCMVFGCKIFILFLELH